MTKLTLRFGGFYESIHSYQIESLLDTYEDQEENYPEICKNYSKAYLRQLESYILNEYNIALNLTFKELDSPREYNFRNDCIILNTSSENEIRKLSAILLMEEKLPDAIKEATTIRSGYYPYYTGGEIYANKDNALIEMTLEILANEFNQNGELPYEFI